MENFIEESKHTWFSIEIIIKDNYNSSLSLEEYKEAVIPELEDLIESAKYFLNKIKKLKE